MFFIIFKKFIKKKPRKKKFIKKTISIHHCHQLNKQQTHNKQHSFISTNTLLWIITASTNNKNTRHKIHDSRWFFFTVVVTLHNCCCCYAFRIQPTTNNIKIQFLNQFILTTSTVLSKPSFTHFFSLCFQPTTVDLSYHHRLLRLNPPPSNSSTTTVLSPEASSLFRFLGFLFSWFDLSLFGFQREHGYGKGNLRKELGIAVKA